MWETVGKIRREDCTGCGACANICPAGAVAMREDREGFLYPEVDAGRCSACGMCRRVCPGAEGNGERMLRGEDAVCYAAAAGEAFREQSSSGGIFGLLAARILEEGGAVAGCALGEDFTAGHILVDRKEDVERLYRSKYMQSNTGLIYREVKSYLERFPHRRLLFSGTPCQAGGLRLYLGREYPGLYTVDLICHGVPPAGVWKRYLGEVEEKYQKKVKNVRFRDKRVYGWTTSLTIEFTDGTFYYGNGEDPYLKAYLKNMMLRPSCTECRFAGRRRAGDITLGDFWGISKIDSGMSGIRGVSLLMADTPKGRRLLSEITPGCEKLKYISLETVLEGQAHLRRPAIASRDRERFFGLLGRHSVEEALEMTQEKRYDIGLMGAWYFPNYGTTLTYYALHTLLESMGYSVLMLEKPKIRENDIEYRENYARSFAARHRYAVSEVMELARMRELNHLCDTFLLGSDQMWTWTRCQQFGAYYFMDFVRDDRKKIAYAASFGKDDFYAPGPEREKCAFYASRFDHISVREDVGRTICRHRLGVEAQFVLDPIFLCDRGLYEELADSAECRIPEKPYLLSYLLDPTESKRDAVLYTGEKLRLEKVNVLNGIPWKREENRRKLHLDGVVDSPGIEDVLFYVKHSSFVLTDSFHGACFAILFGRPFVCIGNQGRGLSRFHSLFHLLGLRERLVYRPGEIRAGEGRLLLEEIDYKLVYRVLERERENSLAWLRNALESPKRGKASGCDILAEETARLQRELDGLKKSIREMEGGKGTV